MPSTLAEHYVNTTEIVRREAEAHRERAAAERLHAAAPELRLPDPEAALRGLHAGDGRAHDRLPARGLPQGRRSCRAQFRARAHRRDLLRGRLDASHDRRADDPRRRDPARAARQCRASRRRHSRAARPYQHPGQHRHPDALQHAAGLSAAAARLQAAQDRRGVSQERNQRRPAGGTISRNTPSACSRRGTASARQRPMAGAITGCRGSSATIRNCR